MGDAPRAADDEPDDTAVLGDMPRRAAGILPPGTRRGRYLLLDPLGKGGMGVVYAAYDPQLDRKVAIKLLRSSDEAADHDSQGRTRFLREAQALARLSHPNVVAAYDVGMHDDEVFIAMELVEGVTLLDWRREEKRPWREVVAVCIEAGRGLAAAHAAGIVHRDFKENNVLIGKDGRTRVFDFGIARAPDQQPATPRPPSRPSVGLASMLDTPLTQEGALVGTPRYMSPEQLKCERIDERSDQYSFCLTLYQALYGEHVFTALDEKALVAAMEAKRWNPPPVGTKVPERVRQVLLRGLEPVPERRYPSMEALLAALSTAAIDRRAQRLWAAGALAVALGAGASLFVVRAHRRAACDAGRARVTAIWNDGKKRELASAFASTRLPYAADVAVTVSRQLDRFAERYAKAYRSAAAATLVDGAQSERVMHLRLQCLSDHEREAATLIDSFARASSELTSRAVKAVDALSPLDDCEHPEDHVPMPADPAQRKLILDVRSHLATIRGLALAGKYDEARTNALAATKEAQATGYAPVEAEAELRLSYSLYDAGDLAGAEQAARRAIVAAERAHHDRVAALAWNRLVSLVGYWEGHPKEGAQLAVLARGAVDRAGPDDRLLAEHLVVTADTLWEAGNKAEALADYKQAIALEEARLPPDDPALATVYINASLAFADQNDLPTARRLVERAYQINRKALGPKHPDLADQLEWRGYYAEFARDYALAEASYREALEVLGGQGSRRAHDVGVVLAARLLDTRHYDEAARLLARAIAAEPTAIDPLIRASALGTRAELERRLGQRAQARATVLAARAAMPTDGATSNGEVEAVLDTTSGLIHLDEGDRPGALRDLERALETQRARLTLPRSLASTQLALARALGKEARDRALALARAARAEFAQEGEVGRDDERAASAFLLAKPR